MQVETYRKEEDNFLLRWYTVLYDVNQLTFQLALANIDVGEIRLLWYVATCYQNTRRHIQEDMVRIVSKRTSTVTETHESLLQDVDIWPW